ncbi:MAG: sulfatase [Myxococcota bacterium]|nr:sulfatase [Myxococcota bacterium]
MRAPSQTRVGALIYWGTLQKTAQIAFVIVAVWLAGGCSPKSDGRAQPLSPASEPSARANPGPEVVVLISIDTLRADHLGVYGYERFTSPQLDAFAAEGAVFEDASTTAPWTLPSHASMLTGLYPARHGVISMKTELPENLPTLAAELSRAGFTTAAVVNNTWLSRETYGLTRDFKYYAMVDTPDDHREPNRWVTDTALQWLEEFEGERLFLFVHYFDVHANYASLPAYESLFVTPYDGPFTGDAWQLQIANFEDDYIAFCTREFDPEKCRFGGPDGPRPVNENTVRQVPNAQDLKHLEELYDAGIRQLDSEIGRLLAALSEEADRERALIIITSDHGEEFGDHGRVDHFLTQYQEVLRVPLMMRGPTITPGQRIDTPVSLVDLVPTVLSMTGQPLLHNPDGLDLTPLFSGEGDRAFLERTQYGEAAGGITYEAIVAPGIFPIYSSARRGSFKLVHESKTNHTALYDLENDPLEQRDISAEQPEIAAQLTQALMDRNQHALPAEQRGKAVNLSAEDLERLRALGYVP